MIQAGTVLNGRYKLTRPLGQGSQAIVWVAEHLALGSQVAVKLIDPDLAKQADARERFAREASAAAKLRSQHVVQMLDHGIANDQPYIVMELLDGEDLFDRLDTRRTLTVGETSRIITQVARALMRAHAEGIIHRDLKPENVFLVRNDDEEVVKVLDFGVAKVTTPAKAAMTRTGVGTLIGTPHYMSPEQVKGVSEIDHRSDLWSIGVIAYQCLTGYLPFDSEGVGDLLIKITMSTPAVPTTHNPGLPVEFDQWFAKACHKEASERFQTARELAEALARVAGVELGLSQPGRIMVNLADSVDLDWGSLAGVRIPTPGKTPPPNPRSVSALRSREETLDGSDMIEVVEGSQPPPRASAPPPRKPPPPKPAAPAAPPRIEDNPFLASAPAPQSVREAPASGRGLLRSTVTGVSSSDPAPADVPPEFDGSRRRRAMWMLAFAVIVVGVGVTVGVMQSRGRGDDGGLAVDPPLAASVPAPAIGAPILLPTSSASSSASADPSASASAEAFDPEVMKKPTKPVGPPAGGPRPRKTSDAVEIEIPQPDREIRLPLGQ